MLYKSSVDAGGARQRRLDLVGLNAVLLSITAAIIGVGLSLYRPVILQELIVPFVASVYSNDGVITDAGIKQLDRLLRIMAPTAFAIAGVSIGYGACWSYFSARLQAERSRQGHSMPPITAFECCCLAATLTLAAIMRIQDGILTRSLTYDEIFTAIKFVEVDSLWTTVSSYRSFNNHIAYSALAWIAQSIFGRYEWSLRLPALILGIGSIGAFWAFTRHFFGGRLALLGALGLALSPAHTMWSSTGRGYTGMILFTTVSSYLFLRLLDRASFRDALVFTAASVVAIYFHILAALVIGAQVLFVICLAIRECLGNSATVNLSRKSFRLLWGSFAAVVGLVVICYTPVLPKLFLVNADKGREFQPAFPKWVAQQFSGYADGPVLIIVLSAAVFGLLFLRRLSYRRETDYLILLVMLPLLVLWFSWPYYHFPRYLAPLLPSYVLLVVAGFVGLWQFPAKTGRLGRYVSRSVICVAALSTLWAWSSRPWPNMEAHGFREAARAMEMKSHGTRSTAFCVILGANELYEYYSNKSLVVVQSIEEFENLAKDHDETRCAYFVPVNRSAAGSELLESVANNSESQIFGVPVNRNAAESELELLKFVADNSESQVFGRSIVFTYRTRGS